MQSIAGVTSMGLAQDQGQALSQGQRTLDHLCMGNPQLVRWGGGWSMPTLPHISNTTNLTPHITLITHHTLTLLTRLPAALGAPPCATPPQPSQLCTPPMSLLSSRPRLSREVCWRPGPSTTTTTLTQ
jgi:hypothetical protein